MPSYVFVYHGGEKPETPEEGEKVMAEWNAWFAGMGDKVEIPGAPVGQSFTVSVDGVADNGGANPASGYSVINADSAEAACEAAKGCPMVKDGSGTVEVAEVLEM